MEFFAKLSPIDLFIVAALAAGVFAGFTQGIVRSALNSVVVLVAFVVASQLKGPVFDLLSAWQAFTPELREQIIYLVLFVGLVVGGWFLVRAFYKRSRLPIPKQLDELGGAVLGLLFAAISIVFLLLVMDDYFLRVSEGGAANAGWLKGLYDAMDNSVLVAFFRAALIPTVGLLTRPFLPSEIAQLLDRQ